MTDVVLDRRGVIVLQDGRYLYPLPNHDQRDPSSVGREDQAGESARQEEEDTHVADTGSMDEAVHGTADAYEAYGGIFSRNGIEAIERARAVVV